MTPVVAAEPVHVDVIAALLEELDTFYGETQVEPRDVRIRQINEALFGDPPLAHAVLAWDAQALVGLATYSFLWPAVGLTRSLYLKELYVAETARGRGVGKLLMDRLVEVAATNFCSRIEWTTDRDNVQAQRFYEKLGVAQRGDKIFYRLEGQLFR
ncbi:GNAT family N-acetyltransferase [Micromonospora sp. NBC_01655]|uniref:GNAT family N-acetyltransferase n=1 Tax=Micromonospora sp. NBC_01655 TaxID=2975983 RepID=UPI00225147DC|nr:GNAT family N-acetyltransferase [Micromonospora sp. NBC_01655]MCX4469387.1 GNAT family N-acetyltransferase [Micromonospora sp. NBC_01655]